MKIGHKIRTIRESKGVTQQELADGIDVTQQAIELIENDKNKNLSINRLEQIANFFQIPITDLFESTYIMNNYDNNNSSNNQHSTVIHINTAKTDENSENSKENLAKAIEILNKVLETITQNQEKNK